MKEEYLQEEYHKLCGRYDELADKYRLLITELYNLQDDNKNYKALLQEADTYLDINELTNIGHGSILHQKFKDYLKETKQKAEVVR